MRVLPASCTFKMGFRWNFALPGVLGDADDDDDVSVFLGLSRFLLLLTLVIANAAVVAVVVVDNIVSVSVSVWVSVFIDDLPAVALYMLSSTVPAAIRAFC